MREYRRPFGGKKRPLVDADTTRSIISLPAGARNGPSLRFGIRRRAFCDAIK